MGHKTVKKNVRRKAVLLPKGKLWTMVRTQLETACARLLLQGHACIYILHVSRTAGVVFVGFNLGLF